MREEEDGCTLVKERVSNALVLNGPEDLAAPYLIPEGEGGSMQTCDQWLS